MKPMTLYLVTALLVTCFSNAGRWSKWARDLVNELKCGMSLQEVETLADQKVIVEEGNRPWLGKHRISRGHTDLWFQFAKDGGLQSVILAQPNSFETVRLSPRRNFCTGKLTFRLRILLPEKLLGATVYLDGERTAILDDLQEDLELEIGQHQVRIEKEGYEPIVRKFHFSPRDRGDYRLDLTEVDLLSIQRLK